MVIFKKEKEQRIIDDNYKDSLESKKAGIQKVYDAGWFMIN